MRVFIALELPEEAVRQAARLTGAIDLLRTARVSAMGVANLHLTVKYVGEADRNTVEGLCDAMRRTARGAAPVELAYGDVGGFPTLESPTVLYVAVHSPGGELEEFRARLVDQMESLPVPEDTFEFNPHVTLARLDCTAPEDVDRVVARVAAANRPQLGRLRFRSGRLTLLRSLRHRGGALYTPVCRVPLGVRLKGVPR